MINIDEYFNIIYDKFPVAGRENNRFKIEVILNFDRLDEFIIQENIQEDKYSEGFPLNYIRVWRNALTILARFAPEYVEKYLSNPSIRKDIFTDAIVITLAQYHPDYVSRYENKDYGYISWGLVIKTLAEYNPQYVAKFVKKYGDWEISGEIQRLFAKYHPDYLNDYFLAYNSLASKVFFLLAKYNPEYVEKYKDAISGHDVTDLFRGLAIWNPYYLDKYEDLIDSYYGWGQVIFLLALNYPELLHKYIDKNYDPTFVEQLILHSGASDENIQKALIAFRRALGNE